MDYLKELKEKNKNIYPIECLISTKEKNYNVERLKRLKDLNTNLVYMSVLKNLEILETKKIDKKLKDIVAEVLLWSEVAKVGSVSQRKQWKKKGYDLIIHNIGSSEIYKEYSTNYNQITYILIKTHGLIGQCVRGEVNLISNKEIYDIIKNKLLTKNELKTVLIVLNECIIKTISEKLYTKIEKEVLEIIDKIIDGNFEEKIDITEKLIKLNEGLVKEDISKIKEIIKNKEIKTRLNNLFSNVELWYYFSGLKTFSIENQIKILLICEKNITNEKSLSFFNLMKNLYLDYKKIKYINLYKNRIIENYLQNMSFDEILSDNIQTNINIKYKIIRSNDAIKFDFEFSKVAKKLIEFCEEAYVSDSLYNKAVILLYDLLGFRKDEYDRFYNEFDYLQTMNNTINFKARILEFMVGKNILDIGPGGGALMDLILDNYKEKVVYGIDIAETVIEELNKKKIKENRDYHLVKGNALNLENYFEKGSIDTIIYSSIIHELYSYIEFNGKKFNHDTIKKALMSAYDILPVGGRIIIRDGIMSEPKDQNRIIRFKNKEDINILKRYENDFKGRKITHKKIDENTILMNINDAMEFLYTYTWGENSYPLEVKEQFGYFTPTEYKNFVKENLKNSKIVYDSAFLQEGYEENLLPKIDFFDENYNQVSLPNSTFILVIEKQEE